MLLNTERFAMLEIASRKGLRGTLPKGVPNTVWALAVFMMKRTSLLVTATTLPLLRALRLTSCVIGNAASAAEFAAEQVRFAERHASCANTPTVFEGALRLPKNGRATSTPTKALTQAES